MTPHMKTICEALAKTDAVNSAEYYAKILQQVLDAVAKDPKLGIAVVFHKEGHHKDVVLGVRDGKPANKDFFELRKLIAPVANNLGLN